MKLIASGVTFSAAIMRSPSFSRSSSSTMTIMRPSWISAIASSIVANCIRLQQAFYVFRQDIELQVHRIVRPGSLQVRILERVRNYCDGKNIRSKKSGNGQADAVHGDRPFLNQIPLIGFRIFHLEIPGVTLPLEAAYMSQAVDVTLHDMPAKSRIRAHRPFEIHNRAFLQIAQAGSIKSLARQFGGKSAIRQG